MNWKPCRCKNSDDIYYFNFRTGESKWEHPCDAKYREMYEKEKRRNSNSSVEEGKKFRDVKVDGMDETISRLEKMCEDMNDDGGGMINIRGFLESLPKALMAFLQGGGVVHDELERSIFFLCV